MVTCTSETLVDFHQITWCYILRGCSHCCENLRYVQSCCCGFSYYRNVTRAEFHTFLIRSSNISDLDGMSEQIYGISQEQKRWYSKLLVHKKCWLYEMKIIVCWDIMPWSLRQVPLKQWYPSINLSDIRSQKTINLAFAAMRTSRLIYEMSLRNWLQKVVWNFIYNDCNSESAVANENSIRNSSKRTSVLCPKGESSTKICFCFSNSFYHTSMLSLCQIIVLNVQETFLYIWVLKSYSFVHYFTDYNPFSIMLFS
jgi:hypothetical protein